MSRLMNIRHQLKAIHTDRSIKAWKWCMSLAQKCTNLNELKAIYAIFITHGLQENTYAISKLLAFCCTHSDYLSYASKLFSRTPNPNSFFYNTLIRAYSRSPQPHLAFRYFKLMLDRSYGNLELAIRPNSHTFPFLLIACANGFFVFGGEQVHSWVIKNGLCVSNGHVQTALIRFYAECKELDEAKKVFDEISKIDVVQCNVLINGYVKRGLVLEALRVFQGMLVRGVEPDEFCATTGLKACAHLGAIQQGKWIHEYVRKKNWLNSDVFIGTALVDMYAKCGHIDLAVEVFENMPKRNVFSYAAMISGFGVHGSAERALSCLERMEVEDKTKPDGVVLLGVLTAYTHAGLLREGQHLLENMEALYGIVPDHEHYSCVVDLLCRAGRAGQLDEALNLIRQMPMKPQASVWGALLSGCRMHNNVILAELAVRELLLVEYGNAREEDGAYVQLSNIYLAAGKFDDAKKIRRMISDRGLKKTPGCSIVEVEGKVNEFVSGDVTHPCLTEIHAVLDLMSLDFSS